MAVRRPFTVLYLAILFFYGYRFDRACLLAGPGDLPPRRKEGRYKTKGYNYPKALIEGDTLWVALTVNEEDIRVVRVIFGEQ